MGQRPLGPYTIEGRLATGGMAEVFVAKRSGAHGFFKRVALKRILPQFARDPEFVRMFIEEARLAAHLSHPNIVQVFDFGELGGELVLAMELVVGTNINRLLRAIGSRGETVPLEHAMQIASQTAHALAYAHDLTDEDGESMCFVHRDVSPANVLLTKTGHVKLSDFGIARVAGRDTRTDDGHVRGKLGYMSPEQVTGKELDGRSDVFTLSTVLAEMLIGEPLFGTGRDLDILLRIRDVDLAPLSRNRRIPRDVLKLLHHGLAVDPKKRPSASAFARTLDEVRRRRGIVRGPHRLSRYLNRLALVEGGDVEQQERQLPGGRHTSFFDTTGISVETERLIAEPEQTSPSVYRVCLPSDDGTEGRIIGPVGFPRLVQMLTVGEIGPEVSVSKEGSDFVPAKSLPELARFVTSPGLCWSAEEASYASWRGELASARLLPVVHHLATHRETGVLHLSDGDRRKKIYFVEGKPSYIASTDKNELLGRFLVEEGLCLRMEVEMALALLPRYGGRLGDALVGLGVMRPIELVRAINDQVRWRYLEAFRWSTGEWAYVPGAESGEETFPLSHDPLELIRDAAMETDPKELEAAMSSIHERVLVPSKAPPAPVSAYRLPANWERMLAVRGDTSFGSILAEELNSRRAQPEEVYRAFYLGLSCGIVEAA